ncbi:Calcineurin-like phosphoesterase domain-containing protein [Candidatus Magnetomoraceae bacterium gMMP-15]
MRIAVFSDIHGNLEALEVFMADVSERNVDQYICLGDIVGYGANPNECIEMLQTLPNIKSVIGNHDAIAIRKIRSYNMNKKAALAILWTMQELSSENIKFLYNLKPVIKMKNMIFSHSNPYNPFNWQYITTKEYAARIFSKTREKTIFIGHSHVPVIFTKHHLFKITYKVPDESVIVPGDKYKNKRQIINCGSIGQPRDSTPKLCYLIYDTENEQKEFYRLNYDYKKAGEKIIDAGLPEFLALRLKKGI